jgi:hypothetical protein
MNMRALQLKKFCTKLRDKEKRLNQFFKLPKAKMEFEDKVLDRPDEDTSILKSLEDQNIDKLDMMDKIIKRKKLNSQTNIENFFSNLSTRETIKVSENLVERLRLNKDFRFTDNFKQKEILNEYGNYDKYFENFSSVRDRKYDSDDDGQSRWEMKYQELNEKFKNKGEVKQTEQIKNSIEDKIRQDINTYGDEFTFSDYLTMKKREEHLQDRISTNPREDQEEGADQELDKMFEIFKPREEMGYDIRTKQERKKENRAKNVRGTLKEMEKLDFKAEDKSKQDPDFKIVGRVSPWCKEEIYRNYLEGWTVKDLSYKYGILPERVKAIVWLRDLFWKEFYPKIGESGLRRRLESGFEYAKQFGYIDYGKDLEQMAKREQGMRLRKVSRGEIDCKPTKEVEEKIAEAFKKIKPKAIDHIPIKFIGKGPSGYLIKEMVVKRGKGSKRVSLMFRKYCYYKDKYPHLLPDNVLKKKELGPRVASYGYRF